MITFDPYASKVLQKEHHDQLVQNLDGFAKDAGIKPRWIATALADTCGPQEVEYVKKFNVFRHQGPYQGCATSARRPTPTPTTGWRRSPGRWCATSSAPG